MESVGSTRAVRWLAWTGFVAICWVVSGAIVITTMQPLLPKEAPRNARRIGDPPSRLVIDLPRRDALGRLIDPNTGPTFLIYGGSCTECSLNRLRWDKVPFARYSQVIVFFDAYPNDIPQKVAGLSANLRLVADPSGKLCVVLKAAWLGRWYELLGPRVVNWQRDTEDAILKYASNGGAH